MSFFEFPHTRTYDSDLGWIIHAIMEIMKKIDSEKSWTEAAITEAVNAWLDAHPEATTTVQDGSIGRDQLAANIKDAADYLLTAIIGGAPVSPFLELPTGQLTCQGMTSDGEYVYIALVDGSDNGHILKIDMNGVTVQTGPTISAGHLNSLHYADGRLYSIAYARLYTIAANTLAVVRTDVIPQRNYLSVWTENGVLIGTDGYYIYDVESGETKATLLPQIANTPQTGKRVGDFYVIGGINPSSLAFYKEDGSLLVTTEIDNVVDGITINELEDITPIDGGILASFHVQSATQNYCVLARIMFNGSNLKPYYGYGQQAVDALVGSTVYVNAAAENSFANGSSLYPFKDLFQAINCIRYKYGGKGQIELAAGSYQARFYNCDVVVNCASGVTIDPMFRGCRVTIYNATIAALHDMQDSIVSFQNCAMPEDTANVAVRNSELTSTNAISNTLICNQASKINAPNNTATIYNYSKGVNVYNYDGIQAGASIATLNQVPKRVGCYFRSTDGDFSLTFNFLNYSRANPVTASVFINKHLITIQLFIEGGVLKYRECIIYDVPTNRQIAQYRSTLDPENFPSMLRCSIEY